ncbi:hypothetical protein [Streptomyces sp. NPDC048565]|uniref:hypothetical protein n=1 Tax=Streptomyces sp. NPDC048565 TaxID=3155266 RepID=UPI00341A1D83
MKRTVAPRATRSTAPCDAPRTAPPTALDGAAELVGRTFATALQEGLGRVSPPWASTAAAPGGPARRVRPPAPSAVLLRDHREQILTRLAGALPAAMRAAGRTDAEDLTPALVGWARARLAAAMAATAATAPAATAATAADPQRPGGGGGVPFPFPRLELTVATLLLESAAGVLPDLPARDRALRALGHAVRE